MKAARLEVRHTDDREPTVYENVLYWPYGGGTAVDILDEHGRVLVSHRDVENTVAGSTKNACDLANPDALTWIR
jgi:hypothetical protein